jgi:hypothetical protein
MGYEATHRAALSLALAQWARRQAGIIDAEPRIVRGNPKGFIARGDLAVARQQPNV